MMAEFFQPYLFQPKCADKTYKLDENQFAITLPCNVSKDQIKTTINKRTGMLTVSAEDKSEKEFSQNGWTGKTQSFSSFSKSVRLPHHVMESEELMKKVTADIRTNQLKITFPEPKRPIEKENKESSELINIETVEE